MKNLATIVVCIISLGISFSKANACGHEGFFAGLGYSQLFQFSPDNQLTGFGASPLGKVDWNTRWGALIKGGYDFCGTRWGVEVPVSLHQQRLNRSELVYILGIDANAIFHIVETRKGLDFYWTFGTGMNFISEGQFNNNSRSTGVNLNFGPGLQYFISRKKPKMALGISIPFKYTLYFGNHLSQNHTSVLGFPIQAGFTIGF